MGGIMKSIIDAISKKSEKLEKLSAFLLLCFSISIAVSDIVSKYTTHNYTWIFSLIFISVLQFIGVVNKRIVLRLIGSWFSFIIWTWLSFAAINIYIDIFSFFIGLFNIVSFVLLSNRISFNLTKNKKNVH